MTRLSRTGCRAALMMTLAMPLSALAQTSVAFQFQPVADASIFTDVSGTSTSWDDVADGQGSSLWLDTTAGGVLRRALLRFDLGAIPAGWQVTSATLTLLETRSRANHDVALHRVLASWGEGPSDGGAAGVGDKAQAGDTTWRWRDYGVTEWAQRGGDHATQASATTLVGFPNAAYTWGSTAGMVADVQHWLDNPAQSHGWIMIGPELDAQNAKRFDSSEAGSLLSRPTLTVLAAPVPEPGTTLMLALGGMALALGRALRRAA